MKILLTNDDGIDAPGINILADELINAGHDIIIIAPDKEQSAASHSITLHQPLRILERSKDRYAVTGSPADCMILASRIILKNSVELVISGINGGQNMGEDILYSGTVAAALEAMFMGYKAIAISLAAHVDQMFETAAYYLAEMLNKGLHEKIEKNEILNINVPNVKREEIKGIKLTRTGNRIYKDFVSEQKDPRGRTIYWIGGARALWLDEPGTDFKTVSDKFISITPISPNFNVERSFAKIDNWINNNNPGLFEKR
ncbi:MAG: 5'/3'-nucleotidase SurE [Candidatus Cloacimonetes bacterium]|nr:5'/3'-nucleotidase SurE [Candidatus Cloacimonadota bacterium]